MGRTRDALNELYDGIGDIAVRDRMFSDDARFVGPGGQILSNAEHRAMGQGVRTAFPDLRIEVDHALEGDGEIYVEGRIIGTHAGAFQMPQGELPATGKKAEVRFAEYLRYNGSQFTEYRLYPDMPQMMAQLGLMQA
jgi:predicted ester cyclase